MDATLLQNLREQDQLIAEQSRFLRNIREQIQQNIIGQQEIIDKLLICLMCNGHALLEGVPGLAKTLVIKSLSQCLDLSFHRIQFTPDLLPADIIGTDIFTPAINDFEVRKGPIFAHFILADEVNRAPAKVQSALLEAMQERQVTIGRHTYHLPKVFLVMATQNPLEQEGTFPLPEAQADRFMFKLLMHYPKREEEMRIIQMHMAAHTFDQIRPVATETDLLQARNQIHTIHCDAKILEYITHLVQCTRTPEAYGLTSLKKYLAHGASPRAGIHLALASRATAFLHGRSYVIPEDVRWVVADALRHRLGMSFEAQADLIAPDSLIQQMLNHIAIP